MELTKTTETPRSGLQTRHSPETGLEVTWIDWDSPFRATGLRPGDLLAAVNGRRVGKGEGELDPNRAPGGVMETQAWTEAGLRPGDAVTLEVARDGAPLAVTAPLGAESFYYTAEGRRALAPGGPDKLVDDGFSGPWMGWYETKVKDWSWLLYKGWRQTFNTRQTLAGHLADRERVDLAAARYPGLFSETLRRDWEAVKDLLQGTLWPAGSIDLGYRQRQERLAERVAEAGRQAERAFVEGLGAAVAAPFPAPDPLRDRPEDYAGRIVKIDNVTPRSLRSDAGHPWFIPGDPQSGFYFLDGHSPENRALFDAQHEYAKRVSNSFPERYRFYCALLDEPRRTKLDGRVITGLKVRLLAASIGDACFVDVTRLEGRTPFAGFELLDQGPLAPPPDDAPPEEVLRVFFEAAKQGRQDLWIALFADFRLTEAPSGIRVVEPTRGASERDVYFQWDTARRELFKDVLDVRIVRKGPEEAVLRHRETGAPLFRECRIEVEHVGQFDGEYRSFLRHPLHRVWVLQAMADGPWRIRDVNGL